MRLLVIANCQARPISGLLQKLAPELDLLEPVILHLSKDADREAHLERIAEADLIFTQLTADAFRPAHLATRALCESVGHKLLVWPNIFYLGQQPYLRYFTHPQQGRLMGPLEALHDLRLFQSWRKTGSIDPAVLSEYDSDFVAGIRSESFLSLQKKEADCDVTISEFIAEHQDQHPAFFTFNHPSRLVLAEMARRLLVAADLSPDRPLPAAAPEPLSRYQVPSTWTDTKAGFQGDGFEIASDAPVRRLPGKPVRYDINELCRAFQQVYDSQAIYRDPGQIRLTPVSPLNAGFLTD